MPIRSLCRAALLGAGLVAAAPAGALTCEDPAGFDKWLGDVKREAAARGISREATERALAGVSFDRGIIRRDRGQRFFQQSFEDFSRKMVPPYRIQKGARYLRQHANLLARIERQFGVPPEIIVAIWGLESDFGAVRGNLPTIEAIATLAYDCRRTDFFQGQLFDALRLVHEGDLAPAEMRGAWAGEIGQTQFMASSYVRYAVDFDGDGRRDLIRSVPDVFASTANYLRGHGWQAGAGYQPGEANFEALRGWNKSQVYARTIAYFAGRLAEEGETR